MSKRAIRPFFAESVPPKGDKRYVSPKGDKWYTVEVLSMRPLIPALIVLSLGSIVTPAGAEMCTLDPVPAATLLLPYFEVDLDAVPGAGVNTVFTIHNALPSPTIAHISFWTDWSQPVLDFDVFLTGYDAQTVDLYDALVNGNLPVTADEQSDQGQDGGRVGDPTSLCDGTIDSCSPHGSQPSWDGSFDAAGINVPGVADCIDIFPFFVNPLLSGTFFANIQAKLTGQAVDGSCYGADHDDNVARGYVTIDNADACSLIFPNDDGYFSDGVNPGIANNVNQLWGDWYFVDPNNPLTLPIDPLVHVEADDAFDSTSTATGNTFYGRYTQSLGGIDNREPLASTWGFSYRNAGPVLVTDVIVWRDSTANDQSTGGYSCGTGPDWYPLGQTNVVCFNQTEGAVELCSDSSCLPLESQRLELGSGGLDLAFDSGWCYLNLNVPGEVITRDGDLPPVPHDVTQSWVGATGRGGGTVVAGGLNAVALAHACADVSPVILNIFADSFESGDTSAWSVTVE